MDVTPTTDELRALVERLEGAATDWNGERMFDGELPRETIYCRDLRETATALRLWIAERERVSVTHEWCGDDPVQRLPAEFEKAIFDDVERLYEK